MIAPALTPRLTRLFDAYAEAHSSSINRRCHEVGVPLIVLGFLGLLSRVSLLFLGFVPLSQGFIRLDLALVLWGLSGIWYLILDWKLALPYGLTILGVYFLGREIPSAILYAVFALGWALQLVGHFRFEKKRPAFLKNLQHLLIGPFWIYARWVGYIRAFQSIKPDHIN